MSLVGNLSVSKDCDYSPHFFLSFLWLVWQQAWRGWCEQCRSPAPEQIARPRYGSWWELTWRCWHLPVVESGDWDHNLLADHLGKSQRFQTIDTSRKFWFTIRLPCNPSTDLSFWSFLTFLLWLMKSRETSWVIKLLEIEKEIVREVALGLQTPPEKICKSKSTNQEGVCKLGRLSLGVSSPLLENVAYASAPSGSNSNEIQRDRPPLEYETQFRENLPALLSAGCWSRDERWLASSWSQGT